MKNQYFSYFCIINLCCCANDVKQPIYKKVLNHKKYRKLTKDIYPMNLKIEFIVDIYRIFNSIQQKIHNPYKTNRTRIIFTTKWKFY